MIQAGILIKRILASAQYRTKILQRKLHSVPQNHGIVLTYHRVLPKKMITKNIEPGMYVTPETFEHHITFLKKHFDIISLNDFYLNFCLGKKRTNNKPLCSITFDDGWIDFYTYVFPVLIKHNIFKKN